jgi:GTP-binding protein HflX
LLILGMFEIKDRPKMVERALLVGAVFGNDSRDEGASLLEELGELTTTLGIPIAESLLVPVRGPQARLLLGSGKADEIVARAKELSADVIVFDNELSPAQQRNWEELSKIAVIDRQEVILDIFAKRAQTREARLQVDLARLEYSLPRLTRAWSHFGQQAGGIGGKGEGEAQLEIDRRLIRGQIDRLKRDIEQVKTRRATQRKERQRIPLPNAAIVGYTNAGKSSLLRALTGADVLIEDKLFATLDTTTRKIRLPNNQVLLLTDTVGFVRKLPHRLVEAFNATLEESVVADFLIHLLDASQPRVFDFHETTTRVLEELGADNKRVITAFNKIDKVSDRSELSALKLHFPDAVFLSVKTGEGVDTLVQRMAGLVADAMDEHNLDIPLTRGDVLASLHRNAEILSISYTDDSALITARIPRRLDSEFAWFEKVPAPAPKKKARAR